MNNPILFQYFHWYNSPEEQIWNMAAREADHLAQLGVTHVWLPPAYKSAYGQTEPGYAVYDLFDLGEFNQKDTVRTKYGTKDEYLACIKRLQESNMQVLADIVLNHKFGGDEQEDVPVVRVNNDNRLDKEGEEQVIKAWTKYFFPGRNGKYSTYTWDFHSFTGVSENPGEIFLILNEYANGQWDDMIEDENGNYDYLMGVDIEYRNPNVREELKYWGDWYMDTTGVNGLRLDALKHINFQFFNEWIDHLKGRSQRDLLVIGEYWRSDNTVLDKYIDVTGGRIQLFDVPLHFNFHVASNTDGNYDMRTILDNTLIRSNPLFAITFVDNHDTQHLQSLQSPVEEWFKPLAYCIILLREAGFPCIFFPAFYGASYGESSGEGGVKVELNKVDSIEAIMLARKELAYGMQRDSFDHGNTIGWTREGVEDREHSGLAVVITNGSAGDKTMEVGKRHAGKTFIDITGKCEQVVKINEEGFGQFFVRDRSASVWIRQEAKTFFPA